MAAYRTGLGFDTHRFAKGRRLVLGGVTIPAPRGLLGHSDADVLAHAFADAVLGAVADGDIGQHFPNTDPAWKDANSLELLAAVVARARRKGWQVVNGDATVVAEQPKLSPHVPAMRRNLARALSVGAGDVSVKATTAEEMGALGRKEGIAAMAVVLLQRRRRRKGGASK